MQEDALKIFLHKKTPIHQGFWASQPAELRLGDLYLLASQSVV